MENGIALIRGEFLLIVISTVLGMVAVMWNTVKQSKAVEEK
jgi:hypothetical protein